MPLFLREADVEHLLPMRDALTLVERALLAYGNGEAENRPRQRVRTPDGILHVMPGGLPHQGYVGFKAYTSFKHGTKFYFHLFDARTGEYLAIMEADKLGQMRTGAASGVATKFLAQQDAQTVGVYGAGWQAQSQLEAMCQVRRVRAARVYSRHPDSRREFADQMSARLGIPIEPVDDAPRAAFDGDIIITATNSAEPVLMGDWLTDGAHINAIGGNWAGRRELDDMVINRSRVICVDSLEQAKIESGDLIAPIEKGLLEWSRVLELGAIVAGKAQGRELPDDITLFKSHGIAVEDVAVGGWVYEQARKQNVGEALAF
jgi:alanine dehydrogenase